LAGEWEGFGENNSISSFPLPFIPLPFIPLPFIPLPFILLTVKKEPIPKGLNHPAQRRHEANNNPNGIESSSPALPRKPSGLRWVRHPRITTNSERVGSRIKQQPFEQKETKGTKKSPPSPFVIFVAFC